MPVAKTPLHQFIADQFGGDYYVRNTNVDVQIDTTPVLQHNFNRLAVTISNYGANDVFVWPGELPVGAAGFKVSGSGGILTLVAKDDLVLVGYEWHGVAPAQPAALLITEVLQY